MSRALVTLDFLAKECCGDLQDSNLRLKATFLRKMLDGYRDLNTFVSDSFEVKTQVLQYDNAINLPDDCLFVTKVGVLYNGRLAILSLDTGIRPQTLADSAAEERLNCIWDGSYCGDGYTFYNCYRYGQFVGELYGLGRGIHCAGYYNFDRTNGVIYLGSLMPVDSEIVIEYKADVVSNGVKLVPAEMSTALKYYAKSEYYADRNPTQARINREYYEREYNKVKRLYNFRTALFMANAANSVMSTTNY